MTLGAGELEATYLPDLGMLGASLRYRGDELLALPGGLAAYRRGHVMGLPLLAPWANRLGARAYRASGVAVDLESLPLHTDDAGLPIHGTMTARPGWETTGIEVDRVSATMRARFDLGSHPALLASFPFPHELTLEVSVDGAELRVATTVRATGARAVPVSFGYHPYLRLPGTPRRTWRLGLPARRHLELDASGIPTGGVTDESPEQLLIGNRTFDDLFALHGDRDLTLEARGHRLRLQFDAAYPYAQIFVPPGKPFACIEPMTAPTNALVTGQHSVVAPGDAFTAVFVVGVEPLGVTTLD